MANPFDNAGFEDLHTYIQNNWSFVAVVDDGGTEVLRWDVAANSNASWSGGSGSTPLTATLTVTGQDITDAGGSLPVTIDRTESYKTSGSSTRMCGDPFTNATLEAPADEVTITHEIEVSSP
ncbi:hypothetical protein DJ71_02345 [Halorubrum sp. E3]|nr:hypothetical protein DJ71_02345 [Halorubrum sp. E3]